MTGWLEIRRGEAPLLLCFPHTGTELPDDVIGLASPWLARKDADWWVDRLYDFAAERGVTTIRTRLSRSVIDVNRDPAGVSLYPGRFTTGLCPVQTFDGEPLYRPSDEPDDGEIARRRQRYFAPYHAAIEAELARLRAAHPRVVLYDAHSIRSVVPPLFEGTLPQFNIGTYDDAACDPALGRAVAGIAAASGFSHVLNGRFKGGWTTRHYGRPADGIHAIQMELACRGYMAEPPGPLDEANWPSPYDPARAAPLRAILAEMLGACLDFAQGRS